MKNFTKTLLATSILVAASTASASNNSWENEAKDAWIDGKAESTILFNTELNSFDINTDVKNGVVTLTGKVESEVDKALAEELVMSLDGVTDVDNKLTVHNEDEQDSDTMQDLKDAKVTTVVKTRLLMESEVSGTSIDVDTDNGVVTLNGEVESEAEKELALTIAKNTDDVRDVVDNLTVNINS